MNIENIEKTLSKLAKHGDKETMELIVELIIEITKFDGKKTKSNSPRKQVNEGYENAAHHASAILDGIPDGPLAPSSNMNYTSMPSNIGGLSVDKDMLNHADKLL